MTAPTVFISYSSKNKDWVKNWLLPKIESQGIQTRIDYRDFEIGAPSMINMERAVEECAKTILVFTPDWLSSEWTQFESFMLMLQDPIGARKKILPLMLVNCELPKRLGFFTFADFREKDEWDFQFERMTSQIKKDFAALAPAPAKYPPLDEKNIDIQHLPQSPFELFGRQAELNLLDQAWESPNANVLCFVAYGGVGKTTLINKWLEKMRWDNYRGARRVFAWSFYSQGTSERVTSADLFIAEALKWFGDADPAQGSPWDKGQRLAELARRERTLLVLDGMEPLQSSSDFERGKVQDPALATLIRELARENAGLCVITTRECVTDLDSFAATAGQKDLEQISAEAGRALLRVGGVQGSDAELEEAARGFGLHALALNLLAAYLHEITGHAISHAAEIPDLDVPPEKGKHPRRVMAAFETRFGAGRETDLLRVMGLFNSPAAQEALTAVRAAPPIPNLTEHLANISEADWMQTVNRLRRVKLIAPESKHRPETLDAHPLVRGHFGEKLKTENQDAWREGNDRLYEYYKSVAKELPDTFEEMMPLFAAVGHGCQAGKYQETYDDVYRKRIRRGNEFFNLKKLGAIGSELAVLSGFFDSGWDKPVDILREDTKAINLNTAGYCLRALGRLAEAAQPMQAGLEMRLAQEKWLNAARVASNLSELYLTLGDVGQALTFARQSVELADRSGDAVVRKNNRAGLATVLHQAGRLDEAEATFHDAEELQKEIWKSKYLILHSLPGYNYCSLLFDLGKVQDAVQRAELTLHYQSENWYGLLSIALDNLSLGRAHALTPSPSPDYGRGERDAAMYLNRAVDGLRESGNQDDVPRGLLARAEYYRVTGALEKCQRDLDEAFGVASRGGMGLFVADCHLGFARLKVSKLEGLKVEGKNLQTLQPANLSTLEEARQHLKTAKEMIEKMGYHRRDKEVEALEKELQ